MVLCGIGTWLKCALILIELFPFKLTKQKKLNPDDITILPFINLTTAPKKTLNAILKVLLRLPISLKRPEISLA